MERMQIRIEDWLIPVNFFGRWAPEHQTAARHKELPYVEVSKTQFYAAIGPLDIVSGCSSTEFCRFSTRYGAEVGRVYADGRGLVATRYVLTTAFALQRYEILKVH